MSIIGRDIQLTQLHDLLTARDRGAGPIALVSGPAGIGKTALLHEFTQSAAKSGSLVLRAACSPRERANSWGVVHQLLWHTGRFKGASQRTSDTLAAVGRSLAAVTRAPEGERDKATDEFCAAVMKLADDHPLVLAVDDIHEADPESLGCLGHLARRMVASRVLAVFTDRPQALPSYATARAEFARQPGFHQLRVGPLTAGDIRLLLTERLGVPADEAGAAEFHAASGGSPLLTRALVEDTCNALQGTYTGAAALRPVAGEMFDSAVVDCVHRVSAPAADLARHLAVLGPDALSVLLDRDSTNPPTRHLQELTQAGLLAGPDFRHPRMHTVLGGEVSAEERARLHGRAAVLLHDNGAHPATVAEHIVAAGGIAESWAPPLLREAAIEALAQDEFPKAMRLFDLAHAICPDGPLRASILFQHTLSAWQVDPAKAMRRLPELKEALQAGHLTALSSAMSLIKNLVWHGYVDEAAEMLHLVDRLLADEPDEQGLAEARALQQWLSVLCPPFHRRMFGEVTPDVTEELTPAAIAAQPRLQAATALSVVLRGGEAEEAVVGAAHVLEMSSLTPTLETIPLALMTLFYADRTEQVDAWCTTLLDAARERNIALLSSLRAANLIRQGRLLEAETHSDLALSRMSSQGWGLSIALPLASSVYALTAMGRYDEARARLCRPVHKAVFQTVFGQHYLYSRGQFHLATGRLQAALGDFLACGKALESWGVGDTTLIPWRTGVAEARLRLGESDQAVTYLQEELARHKSSPRVHGNALRLLASTMKPRQRLQALQEAVDELQASGSDWLLAHALGDLGRVYHLLGQSNRARVIVRRAYRMAKKCHAEPLSQNLLPDAERAAEGRRCAAGHEVSEQAHDVLSEAELRVAALAAEGHTNREIARRLFITVSTVEQHMTRVLRKLNLSRRDELPQGLDTMGGSAAPAVSAARG
ncbi:helix-turn-helix transcriptional regulator [Streptomyces gossypiisoli]|uniref:helix-turn-helix transcriptional regulator n=1 Tax=Streptomyces gossypiisoli TaxID=2748864 RepID=UPI0015D97125|nr:helix-turn-helix transcriptional regulator [Streptomyces gossypiisoli]